MPDNLTIQISADTGKARADLELLKGKLQELGRDMRAARAEALKTGDRTNLDRLAREYDAVSRSAKGLQTQLRATNREVASPAWGAAAKGAAALNAELIGLVKSSLGIAGGLGGALLGTVNLIGKTVDQLLELRRLSQSTGFSPGAIKAVNETLEDTGQEAGAGNKALIRLSQGFAEVRQAARNAGEAIGTTQRLLRGDTGQKDEPNTFGVDVRRGGRVDVTEIKSAADAFKVLRVDMRKFKDDAAGNDAALQAIIDGFEKLAKAGRIDEANLASMQLFGKGMREMVPALRELAQEAGGLQTKMNELRQQGRFPDETAIQQARDYQKAQKDIGDAVDSVGFSLLKTFGPGAQEQMKLFTNDINAIGRAATDIGNLWHLLTDTMVKDVQEALPQIVQAFTDMFARLTSGFVELGNAIAGWAQSAWDAIKSVVSAIAALPGTTAGGDMPPMPARAAGGMIRGPGSGTSDSILARLSNGEFVMRAAAVNKWGPQFMAALNGLRNPFGYAGGGLVRPRFAAGGMVTARAADGTTVNLHFPSGSSFALRGDAGIVAGLVREGRRAGMLNAGRVPGAFAA